MRTIRVTGKGRIKVKPDVTRITISLEGTYPEYSDTLRHSSQETEKLKDILSTLGFERSALKTLRFGVETEYERYKVKDAYKQRLVGYKFEHVLKVEFDSDNTLLGRVVYALANSPKAAIAPELRISYTVKDPEGAKNELLGRAVADAKQKAAVLVQAAGVTLKEMQSMDYSWGEIDFEVRPMDRMMLEEQCFAAPGAAPSQSYDMAIEPDDIDVADTVTLVWEIE